MYGKKLAYGVKIKEIREIPGADRIELATVMDYTVVVKKGEYKPGDMGIYVEVDSLLPDGLDSELSIKYNLLKNYEIGKNLTDEERENAMKEIQAQSKYPYFEFLRDKKFKIKSMKLSKFGVISQGILFRPVDLGITDKVKEGQDFTIQFNITEIVQDEEEAGLNTGKKDGWLVRKLMRYKWFRNWRKRHNIAEVWDPSFPGKSDEENVQKIYTKMFAQYADKEWVATEKLEGQNITVYSEIVDGWFGRKTKRIGVCSRTRELNPNGNSHGFWDTVKRLHLDEKIKNIPGEWFCRGEHVGPGIQGNIYQFKRTKVYFFDFYKKVEGKWVKLNFDESIAFAKKWDLPFVPVLDEHYKLPEGHTNEQGVFVSGADIMLQQSDKNTIIGYNLKHKREGFVLRLKDDYNVSFKVKNPNYSI
jgi:hypothetical protein